ncbi:hypothetical protein MJO28_003748 [Puccinia striiformis f. sp. tritici]|uniref:Uncharacterized protein n=1 Tax=Puccinia striiformis f. sp. tritici TaxID=168172 RepID=A0ACC0ENP6_9BASI|nr:hypothetical protein Pst134EA_007642 [Puccinia striiformis f. sp. tritici]KAH9470380.1 hypothetical protein Pst134EA_007642 [Puccinia striiformis f. sp. tritici]KAI7956653.1 hypothetical protein MJO28_003748 [Puccinia striiformis f. sp. tritici]KAI7964162.1 hypothetical protein MJO29_004589 [Puccinia striiformis f. sp. tritici]
MLPINQSSLSLLRSSSRTALPKRKCSELITFSRGAKMWVPAPEKIKKEDDNVASLLDSLRLIKAVKIDQPDLPIELTIEPLMKKTVNLNVMKGRFVLANQVPSPATSSSSGRGNQTGKDVIAVILDEESTDDVRLAKELGVDHFGGKDLLDRILAEEIKPTKLLVHSKSPKIQNIFNSAESKKTLFKTLSQLNLIIPSEKRGTMSENLNELIMNSKNSIDWLVKKKPTANDDKPIQPSDGASTSPVKAPKVNKKTPQNEIDSFISIPVGSIQMSLIHLEQNISDFLSMISNLTQFGTSSTSNAPKSTTSTSGTSDNPNNNNETKPKSNFKSGRPIKKPGIHKATLTVKGIPAITVI